MHVTPHLCIATDSWIWIKLNNDENFIEESRLSRENENRQDSKENKKGKKGRLKFAQISTLNSPLYDDDVSLPAANT